ncbi:DUF6153 family protein [Actinomycetes bacterium M1A6_2h]
MTPRAPASAIALLIALTVFGVLLMHSVTPAPSMAMNGGHESMAAATSDVSAPVATGEMGCPTGHPMMHPCAGSTVSWPASTAPALTIAVDQPLTSTARIGARSDFTWGRAPPWTLWELDRSVTLRV